MADHGIIILGAGLGGIGMGISLLAAGRRDFVILEQAAGPGGTWRDNIYPGAACDTESHLYCYSFGLHLTVSRLYARQPELLAYAQKLVNDHGLEAHIRYNTRITDLAWDDAARHWRVGLADGRTLTANSFIAAWGQLNRPAIPAITGRERFNGVQFHSARWRDDLDLTGLRVASIGNAASAIQYIPEIAPAVGHLTVFQRSPNWIVPRGDRPYSTDELSAYTKDPDLFRANKQELFDWRESTFLRMREGSAAAQELADQAMAHLVAQVPDRTLRAKLTPDFPLGCKRILRSDDYYPALMRDNVELITERIDAITPNGILTADGREHLLDVIIYGTGFETQSFQGPVEVTGRDGRNLRQDWADGARAYLGMTVAGYPNFFLLYGPNTNLGHNSILSMFEAQFGYILQALARIKETGAIDVRAAVMDAFDDALQAEMVGSAWAGSCTSWYKNEKGRVVNNWSGDVASYQRAAAQFVPDFYEVL